MIPRGLCACGCGQRTRDAEFPSEVVKYIHGHHRAKREEDRYRVTERGCWEWLGAVNPKTGYGTYAPRKQEQSSTCNAHTYFYRKYKGRISPGKELDHICRNRRCVNPDHLEPVTKAVNVQRGRKATLDIDKVKRMREQYCNGFSKARLATMYDVAWTTASAVVERRSWKEIA